MKYYIGDVAKVLGTTKEGVRYLEKRHLIDKPVLNESGYREYEINEVAPMRFMRLYRSYGFTNGEAAGLMKMESTEEIEEKLTQRLKSLDERIEELQRVRDDLEKMRNDVRDMEERKGVFIVGKRPAMYRICLAYEKICSWPEKVIAPWFEHMPQVKSTQIHHLEDIQAGRQAADIGLGVWEKELFGWFPARHEGVEYYPEQPCVIFWMEGPPISKETLAPAFAFMERHNMIPVGDIISRAVTAFQQNQEQKYIHQFFVPYRAKKA